MLNKAVTQKGAVYIFPDININRVFTFLLISVCMFLQHVTQQITVTKVTFNKEDHLQLSNNLKMLKVNQIAVDMKEGLIRSFHTTNTIHYLLRSKCVP